MDIHGTTIHGNPIETLILFTFLAQQKDDPGRKTAG